MSLEEILRVLLAEIFSATVFAVMIRILLALYPIVRDAYQVWCHPECVIWNVCPEHFLELDGAFREAARRGQRITRWRIPLVMLNHIRSTDCPECSSNWRKHQEGLTCVSLRKVRASEGPGLHRAARGRQRGG